MLFRMACFVCWMALIQASAAAEDVTVVVGDLLPAEGGNWDPEASPFTGPFGVDFDSDGNMYLVELEGGRVHRRSPDGTLTQIAGDGSTGYRGDGGPARNATFNGMHNCAVTRDGSLYIADSWNHCIRRIDLKTNVITTVAGTGEAGFSGDGGPADKATFDFVMCITLDPDESRLDIADLKNLRIRSVDLKSHIVRTIAGNGEKGVPPDGAGAYAGPLVDPRAVAADSEGNVYVLERAGHALRMVDPQGRIWTVAGTGNEGFLDGPALHAQFSSPKHICVDQDNNVYIADDNNGAIRKYDPRSKQVTTILGRGHGDRRIQLSHPHGVCYEDGKLYVVDMGHNRILSVPLE